MIFTVITIAGAIIFAAWFLYKQYRLWVLTKTIKQYAALYQYTDVSKDVYGDKERISCSQT